jgi:hypothetical protein
MTPLAVMQTVNWKRFDSSRILCVHAESMGNTHELVLIRFYVAVTCLDMRLLVAGDPKLPTCPPLFQPMIGMC